MKNILMAMAMILAFAGMTGCSKVPAGYVGVKVYLLGGSKGVDSEELGVGRYWIGMNEDLFLFPTFSQNYVWTAGQDETSPGDESISFQTKEGMVVNSDIGITYAIQPSKVTDIYQKYRKGIDEITDTYLRNMVRDAFVTVVGSRPVEDVYGAGKEKIMQEVQARVISQVQQYGINIEKIYWIGAPRLPAAMVTALNAKLQSTQMAQQRENEVAQSRAEADKERAKAQGEADAKLMLAEADAKAIRLRADALRDNKDVATLNAIEKWDGKLPVYMTSGAPLPMIGTLTK